MAGVVETVSGVLSKLSTITGGLGGKLAIVVVAIGVFVALAAR